MTQHRSMAVGKHDPNKRILKSGGREEDFDRSKLVRRIERLSFGLNKNFIKTEDITKKVEGGLTSCISSQDLDTLLAEVCVSVTTKHPDHNLLAGRVSASNLHKKTTPVYSDLIEELFQHKDPKTNEGDPLVSTSLYNVVKQHTDIIQQTINYELDFNINYFGFKTLEKSYLLRTDGRVVERPQSMFMRVSLAIHADDIHLALQSYRLMSQGYFTHASPTLFNAGTPNANLCSCYIHPITEDSVQGIYDTLKRCAFISRGASGLGLAIHDVRATGSYVKGIHGHSNGLVPMLRLFNDTARFITQGGNKRPAAFSIYLEPWHADILDFLNLKKNNGKEEQRARDMFYGLWVPDLFMQRIQEDADWTLMSPDSCPGLSHVWGEEFNRLYERYEKEGRGLKVMKARKLWEEVCTAQVETGMPYLMYKDACNAKSTQQHLGTIRTSNPCAELIQYSSAEEVSTCNVASIAVNRFVIDTEKFDFQGLHDVTSALVTNLNKIIDINYYPFEEAKRGGLRHRSMAVGVQGLADAFLLMGMAFADDRSRLLNKQIFETMYHSALTTSCDLAKIHGPYDSFPGSPASKGILQMDMWNVTPSDRYDWEALRQSIMKHGLRNSHLIGLMPTASTSQIFGNCECFEPYTSNLFSRRVYSGEYQVVNPHLVRELIDIGRWDESMRMTLLAHNGSVQSIKGLPEDLKKRYRTVWEIGQKEVIDMAVERGPYVDQSQSMNLFLAEPKYQKLCSMHFYAWKQGLKTGSYYLRMRAAVDAIKFTVDRKSVV